jgi:asparagine synthase (glutamine-hydrolysing)
MCGITGAFSVHGSDGSPLRPEVLERMTETIRHRGPDDAGLVLDHGVALGARRLSIVDVDGGHQPMPNETGAVWGAQNGEIYNHEDLRRELRATGHSFRTRCDTEVLPHLWEEHGPELCRRLRGKYGIAVWDCRRRVGLLARDRLGIKPLYYAQHDGLVVFGSELKSVIASGVVGDDLDYDAIAAYLTLGFVPAPLTPLADVRKLLPGERLVVGDGAVRIERYWSYPSPPRNPEPVGVREAGERLFDALDESVRMRLMSDVPLGAMLSGGLDSSMIVALMARHMREPVKTFSVGFLGDAEGNELGDARRVSEALGTEHHELELPLATAPEDLSRLVWHMDEPLADLSALGFVALCELASRHVTVALSGQGADELLGGYRRHRLAAIAGPWHRLPAPVREAGAALMRRRGTRYAAIAGALQASDPVTRMIGSIGLLRPELREQLFSGALADHADAAERSLAAHLNGTSGAVPLEAAMYLEAQLGLVDDRLHYFDRASMAWSLEVRVPFLDHELVELCAALPPSVKANALEGKRALRRAARGVIPDFVLDKPKLGFFSTSVGSWLDTDDGAFVGDLLLGPDPRYARVADPALVRRLVEQWRGGERRHAKTILGLVMLELWLRDFLPRAFRREHEPTGPVLLGESAA